MFWTSKKGHCIILRIYDALGGKSKGVLTWGDLNVKKVVRVNALEDEEDNAQELKIASFKTGGEDEKEETGVEIEVRAFEIASYKLVLG